MTLPFQGCQLHYRLRLQTNQYELQAKSVESERDTNSQPVTHFLQESEGLRLNLRPPVDHSPDRVLFQLSGTKLAPADSSGESAKQDTALRDKGEMGDHSNVYFGSCGRCREAVHSVDGACRAMGQIFHSKCFTCSSCCKMLIGKPFYAVSGKIYCEDDFLYSGVHPELEICARCGHLINDNVLQARGTSYHPSCFCCVMCGQSLEDLPFAVDIENKKVYCVRDYHKVKAPRCAACKMPILPTEGSTDCIRVVSLHRSYHVECFGREVDLI